MVFCGAEWIIARIAYSVYIVKYKMGLPMMKNLPQNLGQRIRQFRGERGISQSKMARRIDVAVQQYNRYELGKTKIPIDILVRVADILEISTDVLLGRQEVRKEGRLLEENVFYDLVEKIKSYRLVDYRKEEREILRSAAKILADRLEEKKKKRKKS